MWLHPKSLKLRSHTANQHLKKQCCSAEKNITKTKQQQQHPFSQTPMLWHLPRPKKILISDLDPSDSS